MTDSCDCDRSEQPVLLDASKLLGFGLVAKLGIRSEGRSGPSGGCSISAAELGRLLSKIGETPPPLR